MTRTDERIETGCVETEPIPEEEAAAREERRLKAIREGRGMLKRYRQPKDTVERFMQEKHAETAREEAKAWAWIASTYDDEP